MTYRQSQYKWVSTLIKQGEIFNGDEGNGCFGKRQYPFVLANERNNLYPPILNECIKYFSVNNISWWKGKLTNHTLSSQIACLNHLFAIRNDKKAVLDMIKQIEPNIIDVIQIATDQQMAGFIQFEAVSHTDHLNEKGTSRGSNCTSIDALIYGKHKDGRKILFPIEWKYTENYYNYNKANSKKGQVRKERYTELINKSKQLESLDHTIYYFEPFYQLMRQTLWVEQLINHKNLEKIQADDYIHLHVIPSENSELLKKKYQCSGKNMEETWRSCIKNQKKYVIISPQQLLSPIDANDYKNLIEYLNKRYWSYALNKE